MSVTAHKKEVCFLALTRPALTFGVPLEGLVLNFGVCFSSGMVLSGHSWRNSPFMYWLIAIPVHMAMRRLTSWDFHAFRTLFLWVMTTAAGITALSIVSTRRARSGRGVSSSA